MRNSQDQMDFGAPGRMRGQPQQVRIPQRRINRSLQTGVTPSMQQTHNGQGHFQGSPQSGPIISNRINQFRRFGHQRGGMFQQFMKRAIPRSKFQDYKQMQHGHVGDLPISGLHHGMAGDRTPVSQQHYWRGQPFPLQGGRPPIGVPPVTDGAGGRPSGRSRWQPYGDGGHAPWQPLLGGGGPGQQGIQGLLQAMMGDMGQGFNADQFANMQGGNLPGAEQGDFLHALGGGNQNNDVLQALVTHLIQGPAGANGAPGNYMVNPDGGMAAIQQLLGGYLQNRFPQAPPRPPGLFPGNGGGLRNRFPGRFRQYPLAPMPLNTSGGIPQAGLPR